MVFVQTFLFFYEHKCEKPSVPPVICWNKCAESRRAAISSDANGRRVCECECVCEWCDGKTRPFGPWDPQTRGGTHESAFIAGVSRSHTNDFLSQRLVH